MYKSQAAATANPYTLRQFSAVGMQGYESRGLLGFQGMITRPVGARPYHSTGSSSVVSRRRGDSPPKVSFRCMSTNLTSYRAV